MTKTAPILYAAIIGAVAQGAAGVAAAPAKPAAPSASVGAARDVRCLLLANMYAKVAAASIGKEAAGQARLFYLGRVSTRLSSAQLSGVMASQAKAIDPATAGTEMNACLATVKTNAAAVEAAGTKVRATIPSPPASVAPVGPSATPPEPDNGATGR